MVDFSDLSSDGQEQVNNDAQKWNDSTKNEDNYNKWSDNTMRAVNGETDGADDGLAARYGMAASDISEYANKWADNTERSVQNGDYQRGVEQVSQEQWRDRFLGGLR